VFESLKEEKHVLAISLDPQYFARGAQSRLVVI
jgi:hypothetical protein